MRYMNLHFTYLLTYLPALENVCTNSGFPQFLVFVVMDWY